MSRLGVLVVCAFVAACGGPAPQTPAATPSATVNEVASASTSTAALAAEPQEASPLGTTDHVMPTGYERTDSGVAWQALHTGSGSAHPTINDTVEVHYEGWTSDGVSFDSSRKRGKPVKLGVSKVIKGWTEILQLMVVGDRWSVVIPADLAYGHHPERGGQPAGDLTFEIELLDIIAAPKVPDDVAVPPTTATITPSGLAYRVLRRGAGAKPGPNDEVTVHYSGWTTDGKMFDSSVTRGKPAKFGVQNVIKGWTEMLQLMAVGDIVRVWIPGDLAYGNTPKRPGSPAGMLVFDIELIAVHP